MANAVFYGRPGTSISSAGVASAVSATSFGDSGEATVDDADTDLVAAITEQRGVRVDKAGTEEVLTAGTVQTAITLSAIFFRNGAGTTVLNIRDDDGSGALLVGPLTIAANAERVIVFPTALSAPNGVFIDVDSGALAATPGSLIP